MKPNKQLEKFLKAKGYELIRQRKHRIYKNPDGCTFVTPNSASCSRNLQNALRELKRAEREFYMRTA